MKKKIMLIVISLFLVLVFLGILEFRGIIWHNEIFAGKYTIKGLDVSHYQNRIAWDKIPKKYKFIFVKATEGKDYKDSTFIDNWEGARRNGFYVGAYHFFVTSSSGEEQAENFIETVSIDEKSLPPVIDIEININNDKTKIRENLEVMIERLTKEYGKNPILYVTYDTYNAFVKGYFKDCTIWIRDIIKPPKLDDSRAWIFWQYSNRGRVKGIDTFVDINAFYGTEDELAGLTFNQNITSNE
jgi:lysozyme